MCRIGTRAAIWCCLGIVLAGYLQAAPDRADWRHVGNTALELDLAGTASAGVVSAWYSGDGSRLSVRTATGQVFETTDFEHWTPSTGAAPQDFTPPSPTGRLPEPGAQIRPARSRAGREYAIARNAYRSDDGGISWVNLTDYRGESILGDGLFDLAVSPQNPDEIVAAGRTGVWRSLDGGTTWAGLNRTLPNLPVRRLLSLGENATPVRVLINEPATGLLEEIEWAPGERLGWRPAADSNELNQIGNRLRSYSERFGAAISAEASAGDYLYVGSAEGRLLVSPDQGRTWRDSFAIPDGGYVQAFWVSAKEPWIALAALGPKQGDTTRKGHLKLTINGGGFWEDITADLPAGSVNGVTADRSTGAVYVAADEGLFYGYADLNGGRGPANWTALAGLPKARVTDVRLDTAGNQLFAAVEGYGVYAAMAPHRSRELRVVSAADLSPRPAAPGALMSVLGARVQVAQAGTFAAPVLFAADTATQIQIPFEVTGSSLALALDAAGRRVTVPLTLQNTAPALFVGPDGNPLVVNADTGVLLDPSTPARSGGRLQIFATGLGRTRPDWPTGTAAPLENPPEVRVPVKVYLDREPVEVTRATLAPGYVGFYLVEVQLPKVVNAGPAELYVEADGQQSNHVSVYLEP